MRRIIIAAVAGLLSISSAQVFAQDGPVTSYLPAGNIVCTDPEKLADLPETGDWDRDLALMPKGCNRVPSDVPLRKAKRAGKVLCFEMLADPETFVCALSDKVRVSL